MKEPRWSRNALQPINGDKYIFAYDYCESDYSVTVLVGMVLYLIAFSIGACV